MRQTITGECCAAPANTHTHADTYALHAHPFPPHTPPPPLLLMLPPTLLLPPLEQAISLLPVVDCRVRAPVPGWLALFCHISSSRLRFSIPSSLYAGRVPFRLSAP